MHSRVMDEFMECFKVFYWLTVQKPLFCSKRNIILSTVRNTRKHFDCSCTPPTVSLWLLGLWMQDIFGRSQRLPLAV